MKINKEQLKNLIREQIEEEVDPEVQWLIDNGAKLISKRNPGTVYDIRPGLEVWALEPGTNSNYGIYLYRFFGENSSDWYAKFKIAGESIIESPLSKSAEKALALLMAKPEMKQIAGAIIKASRA